MSGEKMLFTVVEVAEKLGISVGTVRNYMTRGQLKSVKLGRKLLFRPKDVDDFIQSLVQEDTRKRGK